MSEPLGEPPGNRKRAYFWLMGTCVVLILLAWNVVRFWSTTAAVVMSVVAALKPVDAVFVEESLELKREYILEHGADILVMGDDWAGKFDEFEDICEVHYLTRTPAISTTALIEKISNATS